MRKVIFLDFDGVIQIGKHDNPWKGRKVEGINYNNCDEYGFFFDKNCVTYLKDLIDATQAKIVISSSWRYEGEERMFELWNDRSMPGELLGVIPFEGRKNPDNFDQ